MMGVLFDKPAVVFAPAPFAASLHNYTKSDYTPQLANVRSYAVTGEMLEALIPIGKIELAGARTHLFQAPNDLDKDDRHNIDLHAAALHKVPPLRVAAHWLTPPCG